METRELLEAPAGRLLELGLAITRLIDAAEAERTLPYSDRVEVRQLDLAMALRAMGLRIDCPQDRAESSPKGGDRVPRTGIVRAVGMEGYVAYADGQCLGWFPHLAEAAEAAEAAGVDAVVELIANAPMQADESSR